jgi:hypothetical protein
MSYNDDTLPVAIPLDELKHQAAAVAVLLQASETVSPELRAQFIRVRAALFQRGIYDPVLVRFDSATAPRATLTEIGAQLATVAASLP